MFNKQIKNPSALFTLAAMYLVGDRMFVSVLSDKPELRRKLL